MPCNLLLRAGKIETEFKTVSTLDLQLSGSNLKEN